MNSDLIQSQSHQLGHQQTGGHEKRLFGQYFTICCCQQLTLISRLRQVRLFCGCKHRRVGQYTTFGQWNQPSARGNHRSYYQGQTRHMLDIPNTCFGLKSGQRNAPRIGAMRGSALAWQILSKNL